MTKHQGSTPPKSEGKSQAQQRILDQMRVIRAKISPSVLGAVRDVALESQNHSAPPHAGDALLSDFFRNHDPDGTFRAATIRAVQQIETQSGTHQEGSFPDLDPDLEEAFSDSAGGAREAGRLPRIRQFMENVDQKTQRETQGPTHTRKRSAGDPSETRDQTQSLSASAQSSGKRRMSVRGGMLSRLMKDWQK